MIHILSLREALNICPHFSISSNCRFDGGQGQNVEEPSVSRNLQLIAFSIWLPIRYLKHDLIPIQSQKEWTWTAYFDPTISSLVQGPAYAGQDWHP
jgi:hypothetical protein